MTSTSTSSIGAAPEDAAPPAPRHVGQPAWRPSRVRQLARAAMSAALPRRMFMVRGPKATPGICLTFDDGPHPQHTPRLLDVLREVKVPATFFVIGKHAERYPEIVRRIAAEGHVIGHHTYSHTRASEMKNSELLQEVRRTDRVLSEITGKGSRLFRPPWGKLRAGQFCRLWSAGYGVMLWSADPKDCNCKAVGPVREWFERKPLLAGDVVLFHDDQPYAAEVLPELVGDARRRGLEFVLPGRWISIRSCAASTVGRD